MAVKKKVPAKRAVRPARPRAAAAAEAPSTAPVPAPVAAPAAGGGAKQGGLYVVLGLVAVMALLGAQTYFAAKAKAALNFDFIRDGNIIGQGLSDGLGTGPQSLAGDAKGDLFFLDGEDRPEMRLQKFGQDMGFLAKYRPRGDGEDLGRALDVDADAKGDVFVLRNDGVVLLLDNDLNYKGSFKAVINAPSAMAVAADGRIFLASRDDDKVQTYSMDGKPLGEFGAPGTNSGDLGHPCHLAFDGKGDLAVLEDLPDGLSVKVFGKDLTPEREFRVKNVPQCAPLRMGADTQGLLYINDFMGGSGIVVYRLGDGKLIGQVKGTVQGDLFVAPGSVGANRYAQRIYVHTIPGLIPCQIPAGHL